MRPGTSRILTFHGVRGSAPTPGRGTVRYGGNTSCLSVAFSPAHHLVLDCGSGLTHLQRQLAAGAAQRLRFDVFLTHYHTDHVEGLRFFAPLYDSSSRFVFRGPSASGLDVRQALAGPMSPPWFPVSLDQTASSKRFEELGDQPLRVEDVTITHEALAHPQGAVAYRLERAGRSIVFVTDTEPGDARVDAAVRRLAAGADVLIHDAQYTAQEYESRYRSWGHSSWEHAVETARVAGVPRLILFHHDPDRTDDELDRLVERARRHFPALEAAREGMTLEL